MSSAHSDVVIFSAPFAQERCSSHTLLLQAASLYSCLNSDTPGDLEFNPWGKPFFPSHPDLHFSITHSGDWWLCAFSGQPVGLDLQIHRSYAAPETLSRRFFHPREDAFLALDHYRLFYDLWCAKESWVKYTGRGFSDIPESFSVVSPTGEFPAMEGVQMQLLPFRENYSLCVCSQTLGHIRFSPLSE